MSDCSSVACGDESHSDEISIVERTGEMADVSWRGCALTRTTWRPRHSMFGPLRARAAAC